MSIENAQVFNEAFLNKLDDPSLIKQAQEAGKAFVRIKLRENSFARAIMQPENITKADCQRSETHDGLVKIVDIEHDAQAMSVNFKSKPDYRYIEGKRFAIPFFKISSERYEKNEAELMAYDYKVTQVIEENSVKEVQKQEDSKFIEFAGAAIAVTGKKITSADTKISKTNLAKLLKMVDADELRCDCVLMNIADYDDWATLDLGDNLTSEIIVNGYTYKTIFGRKLIVTNKSSIVQPGHVWAFAAPQYLGAYYILNDTRFFIKKEFDLVSWQTWEYVGMGFGNLRALAKLELNVPNPLTP